MKRIIAIVLTLAAVLGVAAMGVSAVTKADLLVEAAKSPIYKYVRVAFENAARTVEITDEQAAEILPIVKKAVALAGDNDHGHGGYYSAEHGYVYDKQTYNAIMTCIDEACRILGYTYRMEPVQNSKHAGDIMFVVYDERGKMVFQYDGDVVADTDAATTVDTTLVLAASAFLAVLGIAAVAVSKRRVDAE